MTDKKPEVTPDALTEDDLEDVSGGATASGFLPTIPNELEDGVGKLVDRRGRLTQLNTHQSG